MFPSGLDRYASRVSPPLPLIPLRDISLLPGVVLELRVGRAGTLDALKRADNGLLVFARQRRRESVWPTALSALQPWACTGRVLDRRAKRHHERVQVQGMARVKLQALRPQLISLEARVGRAPAELDEEAAQAAQATYALWAYELNLPQDAPSPTHAVYRMAHAVGDLQSTTAVLACDHLAEVLYEVLERLDTRAGLASVH